MVSFASETRRVGKAYYVQTPYYWFPVDPHFYKVPFFHWMVPPLRAWFLTHANVAHGGKVATLEHAYDIIESAQLLDLARFRTLFPDSQVQLERFAGLPKSIVGIRTAAAMV
jgi:hypothetical protein